MNSNINKKFNRYAANGKIRTIIKTKLGLSKKLYFLTIKIINNKRRIYMERGLKYPTT